MKAINFKLATFSFAALLLASCSDSNDISNSGSAERNTTVVGSAVTSVTAAQELAARVHNYKISSTNTRAYSGNAFDDVSSMPEAPSVPADAKNITEFTGNSWDAHEGNIVVKDGTTFDLQQKNFSLSSNAIVYIEKGGNLIFNRGYYLGMTIYVLEGGKLTVGSNIDVHGQCKVYNYGTIEYTKDNIVVNQPFYNAGDLNLTGKTFDVQNSCYIGGSLTAKTLNQNTGMTMYVAGDCTVETLGSNGLNGGKLNIAGKFNVNGNLACNSSALLVNGCSVNVSGSLNVNSGSTMYVSYLKTTGDITISSGSSIKLKDQSMINCAGTISSNNQDNAFIDLEGDNAVAAVKAGTITFNNGAPLDNPATKYEVTMFSTAGNNSHIIVKDGKFILNNAEITPVFKGANVYLSSATDAPNVVIKKTDCNPEGWNDDDSKKDDDGKKDDDNKDKTPGTIDKITVIDYDTHDHDISATGIMPFGENMYMSYHTRGSETEDVPTGHGGCVEVFSQVTDNKVTMKQYLYDTARDLDFNHLLAVQHDGAKKIYLPGSSNKKGAILGYMNILDNGLLNTQSTAITSETTEEGKSTVTYQEPLQFIQMNPATEEFSGYDENCVVYNPSTKHLIVMTTAGYLVYDLDYNEVAKVAKDGKAKHVAIGNGKIATLFFKERNKDTEMALPARVEIFDASTEDLTNPSVAFDISTIQPNNGKNVIAIDGNNLYVCRGAAGMYVYDMTSGNEVWHYQMPNAQIENEESEKQGQYKALANGLFVDDKYVYVAYGSYGIVVLDKSTHEVIARRAESKSANYVYVHNGYIYVAYGQDRLQVFKLYPNGINGSDTSYNN